MTDFRVEKRRAPAVVTLATGATVKGSFFLAETAQTRTGGERVGDLLNASTGFFPFELMQGAHGAPQVVLLNRAHVVVVHLPAPEVAEDASYSAAAHKTASMLLSTGELISGVVPVVRPPGHDRLSDYAGTHEPFRYLSTGDRALIVNFSHVVQIVPLAE
jgi:hypothetical protein